LDYLACQAGYYFTKRNKCQLCSEGTISKYAATKCETCPAGTKTTDHLSCKDCAAGKYSGAGSARCKPCGVGQVSQKKASNCTACTSGQYASRPDNTCKPCAKGTYSTGSVDSCTKCAVGTYSDPGESSCTACLPGQYYDSKNTLYPNKCVDCYPSTYSPDGYTACMTCPAGTYSGYRATACAVCDAKKGYIVNDGQDRCICPNESVFDQVLQACSVCKPGSSMKPGGGGCVECGPKTYAPRVGSESCVVCNNNKLVNTDRTRCDYCPASFYKSKQEQKCVKCPAGQYSTADIKGCRVCAGLSRVNSAQTGCIAATMKPTSPPFIRKICLPGQGYTAASPEACVDCGPGFMSVAADQTCIPCPVGTYSKLARASSCAACPSRMVVSADRTLCDLCAASFYRQEFPQDYPVTSPGREAKCLKCPAGTYSTSQGTGCLECPNYTPVNADQTGCAPVPDGPIVLPTPPRAESGKIYDPITNTIQDCPAGTEKLFSLQSCTPCMVGYYSDMPGTSQCRICDNSKVVSADRTDCSPCEPGYTKTPHTVGIFPYKNDKEAYCMKCPKNTISDGGPCVKCPTGEVPSSDQSYCTSPSYDECYTPGQIFDTDVGECVPCKPGYADFDVHPCQQCPFNSYQPYYGGTSCDDCPIGMATGEARDDCFFCEASYYQMSYVNYDNVPYDGPAPECLKCAAGTYSVYADTKCHACPAGKKVNAAQTGCE
jgi:Tyrosine-protein kinase ephrin type A/B receptor-like